MSKSISHLNRFGPLSRFCVERYSLDLYVVSAGQLHVIFVMIVFKLLGGDAVDDVKVLVDLGNPDVVPDDHRVRVQWRLPLDVRV